MTAPRPGSEGEHALQERFGTFKRAAAFYDKQMLDCLNPLMKEYIARQEMAFIATSDAHGECDASFRSGPPGFIRVLDDRTLIYPEYRGNGVMASMGNMSENPHVGILFVDFFVAGVGLHVNGRAHVVEDDAVAAFEPLLKRLAGVDGLYDVVADTKKTPERWVVVDIVEAYIHCSKHIPLLRPLDEGGEAPASGDHFKAKHETRPWVEAPVRPAVAAVAEVAAVDDVPDVAPAPPAEDADFSIGPWQEPVVAHAPPALEVLSFAEPVAAEPANAHLVEWDAVGGARSVPVAAEPAERDEPGDEAEAFDGMLAVDWFFDPASLPAS